MIRERDWLFDPTLPGLKRDAEARRFSDDLARTLDRSIVQDAEDEFDKMRRIGLADDVIMGVRRVTVVAFRAGFDRGLLWGALAGTVTTLAISRLR